MAGGQPEVMILKPITTSNILSGYYGITPHGQIYNLHTNKLVRASKDKDGYGKIFLCTNDIVTGKIHKRKSFRTSQLVLKTYVGNPPHDMADPTVDHIDGNINNDYYLNLQWLPRSINSSSRRNKGCGTQNHEAKLSETDVIEICSMLCDSVSLSTIAHRYNVSKSTISNIRRRKTWKHICHTYSW